MVVPRPVASPMNSFAPYDPEKDDDIAVDPVTSPNCFLGVVLYVHGSCVC